MNGSTPMATGVTSERLAGLLRWNLGLTLLRFAQSGERWLSALERGRWLAQTVSWRPAPQDD